ncbi:MAG TPA: hypothetical protein VK730_14440 [Solirubrobacteraceae bacterium]|nr:hypothetical protein [Solirubrobacteraceae bacterium]
MLLRLICLALLVVALWNAGELHRRNCITSGRSGCSVLPWITGDAPPSPLSRLTPIERENVELRAAIRQERRDEAAAESEVEAKR